MANVKNFGLVGVGSDLQFGKAGTRLVNNGGTFNFKASDGSADAAITLAGITSSAGNVTLTTGNVVLTSTSGVITVGTDTTLSRAAAGVFKFNGSAAFVAPIGNTAARPSGLPGMVRANNDSGDTANTIEYFDGVVWKTVANSGTVSTLQTEIDNIETSLGAMVNSSGVYQSSGLVNATIWPSGTTDLTSAINTLAAKVITDNSLDEILTGSIGDVIYKNAGNVWTAGPAGATSGVQGYDAGLAALAAKTSTGYMVQTGNDTYTSVQLAVSGGLTVSDPYGLAGTTTFSTTGNLAAVNALAGSGFTVMDSGTWTQRSLVAPAAGITISNPAGVSGNPTFALANDLAGLEGLATTGYSVRTGDGTWTTRSIAGTSGNIVVTNGSGVSSDTSVDLATVTQASSGNFVKVTLDGFGRVTGNTVVTTADITALVDGTYVNVTGDTMTGNLDMGGTYTVTGLAAPVNPTDAANKSYVDNAVTGLTWKNAARVLSNVNVTIAGPGTTIDGITMANGERVLLRNQTTGTENGIWVFNGAAVAMTRPADAATFTQLNGAALFIQEGTYADSAFTQTTELTSFAGQVWTQFSGAGAYTGGVGIDVSGTVISAKLGAGITNLPSGEIGLDIVANEAIQLTTLLTGGQLTLVLDTGSGLAQSSSGLKINAASVTNAMLVNPSVGLNGDTGTSSLALGQTLQVIGTSVQGISTSVSGQTVTVTAANASSSQKGVASFVSPTFAVTAGAVDIAAGGVTNTQLVNSAISLSATSGSGSVSLGGTLAITSADSAITAVASGAGVALQLNTVNVAHGGTGKTSLTANQVLYGAGTSAVAQSANFAFDGTSTLTVGGALPLTFDGATGVIAATATNSDLVLMPNGTGSVIVGPVGAGLIQSDTGVALTVRGNTTLTLASGTGSTTMLLASGTSAKVSVSGPTAADYATSLAANDLTNKQYVDNAIASGAAAGAVKAYQRVVPLNANGTTAIPLTGTMPAGSTVLSVKVQVTSADTGATLSVGKTGSVAAYMTTGENDPQANGLYVAECFVTEAAATSLIATVASSSGSGSGSCVVIVSYQVAQ